MSDTIGEFYPIEGLTPHPKNPRQNEEAVSQIARSIERFGFTSPIIAREQDKTIIAGHTRWKAGKKLGLSKVPVIFVNLSVVDAELLMIADNKLGEKADWDTDKLSDLLSELREQGEDLDVLGFDDGELEDLLDSLFDTDLANYEENEIDIDEKSEPISQSGEIYKLGEHRLMCGDSTIKENWDMLLDGEEIDMIFTDPPYGVSYVGKTEDAMTIQNDELTGEELYLFLRSVFECLENKLRNGGVCYVASPPSPHLRIQFERSLLEFDLVSHCLTWVKNTFVLGRCDYHYQHEDIFYGWKKGAAHYFVNDRTKSTTLLFDKPSANRIHPTMKPVELIEELINNSSRKNEIIADAFGGSGSTLIACAKTKRKARLIELDPKYCDAIRKRWAEFARANNLPVDDGLE